MTDLIVIITRALGDERMRIRIAAASALACAGLTVAAAIPLMPLASASASTVAAQKAPAAMQRVKSQCTGSNHPSSLCLWRDAGYAGTIWSFSVATYGQNNYHFVGGRPNDQASAFYNHRTNATVVFKDFNAGNPNSGLSFCIPHASGFSNLTLHQWANHTSMNDSISAFNLTSGPC
jgi:peptidase inhibitor family I36